MTRDTGTSVVIATATALGSVIGLVLAPIPAGSSAAAQPAPPAPGSPCAEHHEQPWCDTSLSADERARLLVAELTRDEKFDLLAGDGGQAGHTGRNNGIPRVGIPHVDQVDGPAGIRMGQATALPAPIALAATWDVQLAERYGSIVGEEARAKGNDIVLGPNVNILRVPEGGRNFEAYGEDPHLVSRMAVGWVEGLQSRGVIGNTKHFVANNQEANRITVNAVVDERTLREIYLVAFEATVKEAGVGTIMEAYNRVNGEYMTENCPLVVDTLKDEWGFEGFALTDYVFAQHSTIDSLNCGNDLEMPTAINYRPELLALAVDSGQVTMETIDEHVHRQLRTLFAFGVFDRPPFPEPGEGGRWDRAGNSRAAREISQQAIVLLKNDDGALPLRLSELDRIAVIGPVADQYKHGTGSSQVDPSIEPVTPLAGVQARAGGEAQVVYAEGLDPIDAAQVAAESDAAIVVVADLNGEQQDRPCLGLSPPCVPPITPLDLDGPDFDNVYGAQDELISQVAAAQPNTVVVLETGVQVLMPWIDEVPAVVAAWYPGQEGGHAIAAVLFGDVNPSGKLPATFPADELQPATATDPRRYPGVAENAEYSEGVLVGYRHYDEHGLEPLFPFGHGLSYTTFSYGELTVEEATDGHVRVSIPITNTGDRAGAEAVQLYLAMPDPSVEVQQPPQWLRDFEKVVLGPGETATVDLEVGERGFSYYDVGSGWTITPGCYELRVGRSSRAIEATATVPQGDVRCTASGVGPGEDVASAPDSDGGPTPTTGGGVAASAFVVLALAAASTVRSRGSARRLRGDLRGGAR